MRICVLSFLAIIVISGCTNDTEINELITTNQYYPLQVGKYIDYEISEIIYGNEGNSIDSITSFLREEIVEQRTNLLSELEYTIDRFTKSKLESEWIYLESARVTFSENQVLLKDDNRTFVKLNLPVNIDDTWNGNAFFDASTPITIGGESIEYFKGWASKYIARNVRSEINGIEFEDVLNVELANQESRIEIRSVTELYAKDIGLISKEIYVLDTQCFDGCQSTPWEEKAESGHILLQHIIDHN